MLAECGNFLVVGVLSDSLAKGAQLESKTRIDGVDAISWVDYTFCLEDSPAEFISSLKPSAVVKGNEHENTENLEYDAVFFLWWQAIVWFWWNNFFITRVVT